MPWCTGLCHILFPITRESSVESVSTLSSMCHACSSKMYQFPSDSEIPSGCRMVRVIQRTPWAPASGNSNTNRARGERGFCQWQRIQLSKQGFCQWQHVITSMRTDRGERGRFLRSSRGEHADSGSSHVLEKWGISRWPNCPVSNREQSPNTLSSSHQWLAISAFTTSSFQCSCQHSSSIKMHCKTEVVTLKLLLEQ